MLRVDVVRCFDELHDFSQETVVSRQPFFAFFDEVTWSHTIARIEHRKLHLARISDTPKEFCVAVDLVESEREVSAKCCGRCIHIASCVSLLLLPSAPSFFLADLFSPRFVFLLVVEIRIQVVAFDLIFPG